MKKILVLLLCLGLCGCMTLGKQFNHEELPRLKLGELKSDEYHDIFGKPYQIATETNSEGYYERIIYYHSHSNFFDTMSDRILYLEFKDGILNAYDYLSSFDYDKTEASLDRIKEIKVNQSTKDDIIGILGKPTGKALCPTTLYSLKDRCEKGGEIWAWSSAGKVFLYSPDQKKESDIHIVFNKNSVVSNIHTYKSVSE